MQGAGSPAGSICLRARIRPVRRIPRIPRIRIGLFGLVAASAPLAARAAPDLDAPALTAAPAPATPETDVVVVQPTASRPPQMGWLGLGVRFGLQEVHLTPPASFATVNSASGQAFAAGDFAIDSSAWTVTPTLHLGGSGFFFKLDLPLSFSSQFTSFGLGLYPINFGVFVESVSLFPYASLGGAANLVESRDTGDPSTSNKLMGAMVQARGALGLKYFPAQGLALSAEIGYSPWAAGILLVTPANSSTQVHGGFGSVFDFSLGVEWL
jgi:hypothetical protein